MCAAWEEREIMVNLNDVADVDDVAHEIGLSDHP
jgi:hypothetical protein